jgi:integrase
VTAIQIQLVRQSAERKAVPVVFTPMEVQRLLSALALRERMLVLVAFGTGLWMSELFALKWRDVNFQTNEVSIVRSIVFQIISPCKTEASQKPVPLDPPVGRRSPTMASVNTIQRPG